MEGARGWESGRKKKTRGGGRGNEGRGGGESRWRQIGRGGIEKWKERESEVERRKVKCNYLLSYLGCIWWSYKER